MTKLSKSLPRAFSTTEASTPLEIEAPELLIDVQPHCFVFMVVFAAISNLQSEEFPPKIEEGRESSNFVDIFKFLPDGHGISEVLYVFLGVFIKVQEYHRCGVVFPFCNFSVISSTPASVSA